MRILLVDDDRAAVDALRTLLELDGYQVIALTSGAEALTALHDQRFDALITDLEMPRVHGLDIVRAAHQKGLPTLVVTAHAGLVGSALALGARRVFGKPLPYDDFAEELAQALRQGTSGAA